MRPQDSPRPTRPSGPAGPPPPYGNPICTAYQWYRHGFG